ncbi:hypothetical protein [Streptomyces sp. NPDC052036]|uniref:hypothetical protein n=1 Tax=Streptomyces sp. NPDC052036 TaxID=3155171 RepID=UPI003432F013
MDRLHELISAKLRAAPALERAPQEAESGQEGPSERTRPRLVDSLEDAAEHDPAFAEALDGTARELQTALAAASGGVSASGDGQAIGGSVGIRADRGSAAALRMRPEQG